MKIIQIHNFYRIRGGEGEMFDATVRLLKKKGVEVHVWTQDSKEILKSKWSRVKAFGSGIYSFSAAAAMKELIFHEKPDVVHVHNLHPLFSPSVLVACHQAGVPVVMTCHNYRLVCPTGMHMRAGEICELCLNGREYWCALTDCKGNVFKSFGYAVRNTVHRKARLFTRNVSLFVAISKFVKRRLVAAGLPNERIMVVPNMVAIPTLASNSSNGDYVAFAGRFSPQKGIETLIEATCSTKLPVRMAGDYSPMSQLLETAPKEIVFMGPLGRVQIVSFYRNARLVVVPSKCLEPFGLVAAEAMAHGLPVIASRIGGLEEIVEDGVTGFLFEPGNSKDLASKMKLLWEDPELCHRFGAAGREKAVREYSEDVYFERLMEVYNRAIRMKKR